MTRAEQLRHMLDVEQARNRDLAREVREERQRARGLEKALVPLRAAEEARQEYDRAMAAAVSRPSVARYHVTRDPPKKGPGIPTAIISDLHLNESVDPAQVFGVNAFNPEIGKKRLHTFFHTVVDLGQNHVVKPTREGIVAAVLGDLLDALNGKVHRSERTPVIKGIDAAALVADELEPGFILWADAFGGVQAKFVSGNHGRTTDKVPYCDRNAENLDYAVFKILEGRLRKDKRITLEHAEGPRLLWSVYGHRFLGLHGDPASGMPKGGDSEAGAANIVARGVKRLRSLHMQIGLPFDTALMGHFHTKIEVEGALVNGCLPGFGEYSNGRAFPFGVPFQRMFYTHPKYGITQMWNVYLDKDGKGHAAEEVRT